MLLLNFILSFIGFILVAFLVIILTYYPEMKKLIIGIVFGLLACTVINTICSVIITFLYSI